MSWKNVSLIFVRELRDQIRDRRTLFMIIVLPLILYPTIGLGIIQMAMMLQDQSRNVVILGAEDLPQNHELILFDRKTDRIEKKYFKNESDSHKLQVFHDTEIEKLTETDLEMVQRAQHIRDVMKSRPSADRTEELEKFNRKIGKLLAEKNIQVILVIPNSFSRQLEESTARVKSGKRDTPRKETEYLRPLVIHNRADEKSKVAYRLIAEVLNNWEKVILRQRMFEANLSEQEARPVNPEVVNVAEKAQISANFWSKIFPALLVLMAVTGAFYPAVDLTAGEKERGTMETLLICPASRTEIVIGKFLTVMAFSVCTAILNLLSMGLTGQVMFMQAVNNLGSLNPPSFVSLFSLCANIGETVSLSFITVEGEEQGRSILSHSIVNGDNGSDILLLFSGCRDRPVLQCATHRRCDFIIEGTSGVFRKSGNALVCGSGHGNQHWV